ncbi:hypothetical protein [Seohaeicola zhoushanensis]|uniref:Lipoprotein n=1 Tax=Seohaeicola zhoushanensis TaxID=1569283 RepID=A0A8J3GXB0_9RHOB|nr:hypothetical protein [Seohaeicola zhoushanensis]GHF47348.1 hypothetical protein GCM10017056_18890 [Seohaeicola zhoushanensis]
MAKAMHLGSLTRMAGFGALCALLALTACVESKDKRILFDGFYFRTKAKKVDKDYSRFIVTAKDALQSVDAARQAAEYEGTRYCLENGLGTSRIKWIVGPETPDDQLVFDGDTLVYEGECNP